MAKRRSSRTKSSASRQRGLGLLFWLCLVVIIVAVAFAAREPIKTAYAQVVGGHRENPAPPLPRRSPSPRSLPPSVRAAPLQTQRHGPPIR